MAILPTSLLSSNKDTRTVGRGFQSMIRIARDLNEAEITALKEYTNELTDIEINTEAVRYYPHGKQLAHVLGYTRELTPEQLEDRKPEGYRLGDVIGRMGVETAYEQTLRGEWGGQVNFLQIQFCKPLVLLALVG